MEIKHLKGNTWIIAGPVNIGVYVIDSEAVLIDSGNDESAGRKILRLIEAQSWRLRWIVNTHSHADHIGGNAFIQKRTGCGIAASAEEAPFIDLPAFAPSRLWSGNAPRALRNKFLQAEPSAVTKIFNDGDILEPFGLAAAALPGHMTDQIGVRTPDGVFFTADTVLAERILEKYGIPFIADYDRVIATLEHLGQMAADLFVPSHGEPTAEIASLVGSNRECLLRLKSDLAEICAVPVSRDAALAALVKKRGLNLDLSQYSLLFSTISSVLTSIIEAGAVSADFVTGTLLFQSSNQA